MRTPVYTKSLRGPLSDGILGIPQIGDLVGVREFFPSQECMTALFGAACIITPELCSDAISAIMGYNPANLNWGRVPTLLTYFPSGAAHWASHARCHPSLWLLHTHRVTY